MHHSIDIFFFNYSYPSHLFLKNSNGMIYVNNHYLISNNHVLFYSTIRNRSTKISMDDKNLGMHELVFGI